MVSYSLNRCCAYICIEQKYHKAIKNRIKDVRSFNIQWVRWQYLMLISESLLGEIPYKIAFKLTASRGSKNAHWEEWKNWSQCSSTCGSGTRTRQRVCTQGNNRVNCSTYADCTITDCTSKFNQVFAVLKYWKLLFVNVFHTFYLIEENIFCIKKALQTL